MDFLIHSSRTHSNEDARTAGALVKRKDFVWLCGKRCAGPWSGTFFGESLIATTFGGSRKHVLDPFGGKYSDPGAGVRFASFLQSYFVSV